MVDEQGRVDFEAVATGLMIMALGTVLLVSRHDSHAGWRLVWLYLWPMQLVAWGVARMLNARRLGRRAGFWPIFFGLAFLTNALGLVPVHVFWPALLTAVGLAIAWRAAVPVSRRVE